MSASWTTWTTERAMVADFTAWVRHQGWQVYAETGRWDLVVVRPEDGFQIGIEAKLRLNADVLCQVLAHDTRLRQGYGPDCRAVLVPEAKAVGGLVAIARRLNVVVVTGSGPATEHHSFCRAGVWYGGRDGWKGCCFNPGLPDKNDGQYTDPAWPELCPDQRITLPEYVPDVVGGASAPVALTHWKIQAIKIACLLEYRGWVTRSDFKALHLHMSRWTEGAWLSRADCGRWIAGPGLPDFRAQHPMNYEQIKADLPEWGRSLIQAEPSLSRGAAA